MKKQIQTALEESPPDRFQRLQTMKSRLISVLLSGEKQKLRKIFSNIVCANNPTAKRPQLVKLS